MPKPTKKKVQSDCEKLVNSLGGPAFIVLGWKKENGEIDLVQMVEDMDAVEYYKGMTWAMAEVTNQL